MELAWIDDFIALNSARHFTRAAALRHTTQPAFSRRIQRLEEWLGAPLFNREATPVTLTAAGEEFLQRASRLRDDILDARRATLSIASNFVQSLRLMTTNTIATSFLPTWLKEKQFQNYSLVVASNTGCLEAVRQKRAHLAIISRFEDEEDLDGLEQEIIGTDSLSLVATPAIAEKIHIENSILSGPLMLYTPGTAYGGQIAKKLAEQRICITGQPVCESASAEALLAQAKAGLGAAWLPRLLVDSTLQNCVVPTGFDIPYHLVLVKKLDLLANR